MTLDDIALKYATDKSSTQHNYTEKYDRYFSPLRNEKLKVLEIGIQNGFSLKTWKEYFPNAEIFGIDIVDCSHMDEERVTTLKGSQNDLTFLKKINDQYGPFDIIIDDGSHNSADMRISFDFLFPLLKKDGLYVVEDIVCVYWPELSDGGTLFMDRLKELLDIVNGNGKCGLAEMKNIDVDHVYQGKKRGAMDWWEESVEYVHLYRSIAFIKKYAQAPKYLNPPVKSLSGLVRTKRFASKVYGRLMHMKNVGIEKVLDFKKKISEQTMSALAPEEIRAQRETIKVYDIFTYNGEADILELRLNILNNAVDQFIIVEAPTTFSGLKKPLYFEAQKERFAQFTDKIKYFVVDEYPTDAAICALADASSNVPTGGPEHWRREFYQKESIKKALVGIADDDFCFVGDVDEIWNPLVQIDWRKDDVFKLKQELYVYFLNNKSNQSWIGTIATKYKNIKNACLNHLRTKGKTVYTYVDDGGWHFTNMGGIEEIRRKLNDTYTEESYNTKEVQDNLEKRFGAVDYVGRKDIYRVDESTLPHYIVEHKELYNTLLKHE